MREILFRGRSVDTDEWVYGSFCIDALEQIGHPIEVNGFIRWYDIENKKVLMCEVERDTVGQYTGLCDKNGKKIFEGDILKGKHQWRNWNTSFGNDEKDFLEQKIRGAYGKYIDKTANEFIKRRYHYFRNYAVEYYAPNGGYRVRNGGQFHRLDQSYIFNRELEIIGNIHDNPELLKGGAEI